MALARHAFVLEEQIGDIACRVEICVPRARAEFDLPRLAAADWSWNWHRTGLRQRSALHRRDIGFGRSCNFASGRRVFPMSAVPVKPHRGGAERAVNEEAWLDLVRLPGTIIAAPYIYCPGGDLAGSDFHARMFAPWDGIKEDPATGSAAAALSGALAESEALPQGEQAFQLLEQGVEMGRPSSLTRPC